MGLGSASFKAPKGFASWPYKVCQQWTNARYYRDGGLGIQVWNSKIDFNMEALSIDCRNKHWSQCFNQILILSSGLRLSTIRPAVVVQAALESRAACTTTAGHIEVEPADEIKIRLKHCGQCLFLQSMLSASIFKWIFDFRIGIPTLEGPVL